MPCVACEYRDASIEEDLTYDEAKGVLEACGWNLLDAFVALEKEGIHKVSLVVFAKNEIGNEWHEKRLGVDGGAFLEAPVVVRCIGHAKGGCNGHC